MKDLIKAVSPGTKWTVHTAAVTAETLAAVGRVKAIKLTASDGTTDTALTVVNAAGDTQSTGQLGLHVLEPMAGISAVTELGANVVEFRVYYY